jgi:DNA mismatch endonuclease (patch repair protein)
MMSGIRGRDTGIELRVRKGLHRLGFRYRLGGSGLPGRPDVVLPKYRATVFVHGCFWHGHNCHLFRLPKTRAEFWRQKIEANRVRDRRSLIRLERLGWKPFVIWECSLRSATPQQVADLLERLVEDISEGRNAAWQ